MITLQLSVGKWGVALRLMKDSHKKVARGRSNLKASVSVVLQLPSPAC